MVCPTVWLGSWDGGDYGCSFSITSWIRFVVGGFFPGVAGGGYGEVRRGPGLQNQQAREGSDELVIEGDIVAQEELGRAGAIGGTAPGINKDSDKPDRRFR